MQARLAVPDAQAIAQRPRDAEFHSVFIKRKELDIANLADLAGRTFTFGSESSTSGYLMPLFFLSEAGIDVGDLKSFSFSASHDTTWKLVEAGALNAAVWEQRVAHREVDLNRVEVFYTSPAYVDYHWVERGDLDSNYGAGTTEKLTFVVARGLFIVTRGVPELIWAFLIVFIFSPGILSGAIALAIHNSGILGKLAPEAVEGLDPRPIRSLLGAGAGQFQVLFYGVLPQALPKLLTFLLHRWEVIVRTTIVVGFVAAGGLGQEFRLSMSHFQYTTVTLILIWYLGLVIFVDVVAAGLRRLAR